MSSFVIHVESIVISDKILSHQSLVIKDGRIEQIHPVKCQNSPILAGTLIPGFIDLQVNGGNGCLFNNTPDLETIQSIGNAHHQFGTTGWLPTLVTDSIEKMALAADAVAMARKQNIAGILGVHFEGPCLSQQKKGIHPAKFIRQLNEQEEKIFTRQDLGQVVVTLAPESVTEEQITRLSEQGVHVSLGHSHASYDQTKQFIRAGASGFTHLFNAMSQLGSREPGMVGAALESDCYYGLILDGLHVHPKMANMALRLNKKMMLVTDAMPPVGSDQRSFEFFGELIKAQDDQLIDSQGRIAGSLLDMGTAVRNAISMLDLTLPEVVKLSSENSAKFLGVYQDYGSLEVGKKASMLLIDKNNQPNACWIDGKQVFQRK